MNYFDYLRMTRKKDTKDNFIDFLVSIVGYNKKDAKKYASYYYQIENED